jgi:hypothetical protein
MVEPAIHKSNPASPHANNPFTYKAILIELALLLKEKLVYATNEVPKRLINPRIWQ